MGAACTILVVLVTLMYGGYRASILHARSDVDVMASIQKDYHDMDYTFGAEQGLNLAVAVFNGFDPSAFIMDPTYGKIQFWKISTVFDDAGVPRIVPDEIEPHTCTEDELLGDNAKFHQFNSDTEKQAKLLYPFFLCVNPQDLEVKGNIFNAGSYESQWIEIVLLKCDRNERDDCKTEDEILEYFGDREMFLVKNEIRFD